MDPQTVTAILGMVGVVGTLGGAALGAYGAWRIHASQMEHQDKTRFHDVRFRAYAEYVSGMTGLFGAALAGKWDSKSADRAIGAFGEIQICGGHAVTVAAGNAHQLLSAIRQDNISESSKAIKKQLNDAMGHFLVACRTELGVSLPDTGTPALP